MKESQFSKFIQFLNFPSESQHQHIWSFSTSSVGRYLKVFVRKAFILFLILRSGEEKELFLPTCFSYHWCFLGWVQQGITESEEDRG